MASPTSSTKEHASPLNSKYQAKALSVSKEEAIRVCGADLVSAIISLSGFTEEEIYGPFVPACPTTRPKSAQKAPSTSRARNKASASWPHYPLATRQLYGSETEVNKARGVKALNKNERSSKRNVDCAARSSEFVRLHDNSTTRRVRPSTPHGRAPQEMNGEVSEERAKEIEEKLREIIGSKFNFFAPQGLAKQCNSSSRSAPTSGRSGKKKNKKQEQIVALPDNCRSSEMFAKENVSKESLRQRPSTPLTTSARLSHLISASSYFKLHKTVRFCEEVECRYFKTDEPAACISSRKGIKTGFHKHPKNPTMSTINVKDNTKLHTRSQHRSHSYEQIGSSDSGFEADDENESGSSQTELNKRHPRESAKRKTRVVRLQPERTIKSILKK